jgi:subtilisin family serine protease/Ca2+-binding RTX toxin-like protein
MATEYASDRLIVKFNDSVDQSQINAFNTKAGVTSLDLIDLTGAQVLQLPANSSIPAKVTEFLQTGLFEYVEPDFIINVDSTTPNDIDYPKLWGLNNTGQTGGKVDADIDAPEAWDLQKGNPNFVIGVIDTGVDTTHPDLINNIWTNPGEIANNGIDDDENGYIDDVNGWDFAYDDNAPTDLHGHGTHVSGTIAGDGNNAIGVSGVVWDAKIMPLKFIRDTGSGYTSDAVDAISYAANMGVKLTNNSWGGAGFSQALLDAINTAAEQGSLFIAAAGNSAMNSDITPSYPAAYNAANIVSVAATTNLDGLASFSNYGAVSVDLGAPGKDIYSTFPMNGSALGKGYGTISGTSMAAPHVTGAAALLWSQHPNWSVEQVKAALMNSVDPLVELTGKTVTGGRLNVNNALLNTNAAPTGDPTEILDDGVEDTVYTITETMLLSGFEDAVDNDSLRVVNLSSNNGTLTAITGGWTFKPNTNYNGMAILSYEVSDGIATVSATQSFNLAAVIDVATGPTLNPIEGSSVGNFSITLDSPAPADGLVVNFALGGTATLNTDYKILPGTNVTSVVGNTFTVAAGQKTIALNVSAMNDSIADPNETVTLSLLSGLGYQLKTPTQTASVGILENGAPSVIAGTVTSFVEQTPVALANGILINDANGDADWNGGKLVVQITGNATADDKLVLPTVNNGGIWLNPFGNVLMANTTSIGSATASTVSNNTAWQFNFNAAATNALVQSTARAIQFSNSSDNPSTLIRTATYTATDKNLATGSANQTVSVTAVNDAPTLTAFASSVAVGTEDTETAVSFANLQIWGNEADVDGTVNAFAIKAVTTGTLKIGTSAATATAWSLTNNVVDATHQAYWTPAANANGVLNAFTVVAKDNAGLESAVAIQAGVNVTAVNDAPVLSSPAPIVFSDTALDDNFANVPGTLTATDVDSSPLNFGIAGGTDNGTTISKIDVYGTLTVTKASGAYSFVPNDAAIEALKLNASASFTVTASDGSLTDSKPLVVNINQSGETESPANDNLLGTANPDKMNALAGNDILNALAGADTMTGGSGSDSYFVDNTGDVVIESSSAIPELDTVNASVSYKLPMNVEKLVLTGIEAINGTGNGQNNTLTGNPSANTLDGLFGVDTMTGGSGNDLYYVDNQADKVIETSSLTTEIDSVVSSVNYTLPINVEKLTLDKTAVKAIGNALNNTLTGNSVDNLLNGDLGADTMAGGTGKDTYLVDNPLDAVTETSTLVTEIDQVKSSVSFALGANLENITLTGSTAINAIGNALKNTLTGNIAPNVLSGGGGNDTYLVGAGDTVVESSSAGTDRVNTAVSFTLPANVEMLTLTGGAAITGTGNELANMLASDTNKAGNVLIGGAGNDSYIIGAGDTVIETSIATNEIDTVNAYMSYILPANVENLSLIGTSASTGMGNTLSNLLTGNSGGNFLSGSAGDDILNGGLGNDILNGGTGLDIFQLTTTGNIDTLQEFSVIDDIIQLENTVFTSLGNIGTLPANSFKSGAGLTAAADADDFLIYNSSTGGVYYDAGGNTTGSAATVQIALLGINLSLTNADFAVI